MKKRPSGATRGAARAPDLAPASPDAATAPGAAGAASASDQAPASGEEREADEREADEREADEREAEERDDDPSLREEVSRIKPLRWPQVGALVGAIMHVPGLMALVTMPVAAAAGEGRALVPLFSAAVAALGLGQWLLSWRDGGRARLRETMVAAALGWAACALLSAGLIMGVVAAGVGPDHLGQLENALFEATSGITSTGMTMVKAPQALPALLQWWRALSEWVGGMGLVVLIIGLSISIRDAYPLYFAEARSRRIDSDTPGTARRIWLVYVGLTLAAFAAFWAVGMAPWEAGMHALTATSTGGFTITERSMGSYGWQAQAVVMGFMVLGAIDLLLYVRLARGRGRALWRSAGLRWYLSLVVVGGALFQGLRWLTGGAQTAWQALFQWTSAVTTCGFSAAPLGPWSDGMMLGLIAVMIIGGMSGSTAGGLKIQRLRALIRDRLIWTIRFARAPQRAPSYEAKGTDDGFETRDEEMAISLIGLWVMTLALGAFVLVLISPEEISAVEAFFDATSAMSGVGLSTSAVTPEAPAMVKGVLIALMLMGRLELLPVLVLIVSLGGRGAPPRPLSHGA